MKNKTLTKKTRMNKPKQTTYIKGMVFAALFAALTAAVSPLKIPLGFTPVPITLQTLMVLLSGAMLGPYYGALAMILYILVGALGLPVFAGGGSGIGALLGHSGGYLFSYFIAAFVVGKMLEKKNLTLFIKYFSFVVTLVLIAIVFIDSTLNMGIMKLWDSSSKSYLPMISMLSGAQRTALIALSIIVLITLLFLVFYLKKKKMSDIVLAMFAGTLVIYLLGSIQGKIVTGLPWSAIFIGWVLPFIIGDTIKLFIAAYIAKNADINKYMK